MCKTDTVSDLGWFRGLVFNTMCTSIIYSSSFTTYSQAYKYLDIDTVIVILAICQLNTLNIDVHTFIWFTSKLSEQCSDYSTFYIGQLDSWTVQVIGQLVAQLFHGQMCVIRSLFHLQISR